MPLLEIANLHASAGGKPILKGVNLVVNEGEVHAIMGPNGSGKSTLANVLAGSPATVISEGAITFRGANLLSLPPDERARAGIFIAFQHPAEIQGLKFHTFLKRAVEAVRPAEGKPTVLEFRKTIAGHASGLRLPHDFEDRDVNHGLSGGEKKRSEILQLNLIKPSLALLDEIDSGLDVDSVKTASTEVNRWQKECNGAAVLMTHYSRVLEFIKPQFVHVMLDGRIVKSGGPALAAEIEASGYEALAKANPVLDEKGTPKEEFYTSLIKLNKEKAGGNARAATGGGKGTVRPATGGAVKAPAASAGSATARPATGGAASTTVGAG